MQQPSDTGTSPSRGAAGEAVPSPPAHTHGGAGRPCARQPIQEGPRAAAEGFTEFSEGLVPKYAQPEAAESALQAIERCLAANFDMAYLAPYGSRGHGTNVAGYSAVDSFAVMRKSQLLEDSGQSLEMIREALAGTLPGAFVTEGRPVVAVSFGERRSQRHHIVPAFQTGEKGKHDIFSVPAPRGRWNDICPGAHSVWINALDDALNKNLKPFIRVIKAWSYFNGDAVWPYYLELCAADFLKKDSSIVYSVDLSNFFAYMVERDLAPFVNAAGCMEPVYGTSVAGRTNARAALRAAADMACKARTCEQRGNIADAYYWWRKLFNWRFAAY